MIRTRRPLPCLFLAAGLLSGCAPPPQGMPLGVPQEVRQGDPAHPVRTRGWVETRLFFGLSPAGRPDQGVSEQRWRDFLDREVTSRFPDGLSVLDVYGQWQGPGQSTPERLRSRMLLVDYPDTAANRARIEAIRAAWKRLTGDRSVLRVTEPADVSF